MLRGAAQLQERSDFIPLSRVALAPAILNQPAGTARKKEYIFIRFSLPGGSGTISVTCDFFAADGEVDVGGVGEAFGDHQPEA